MSANTQDGLPAVLDFTEVLRRYAGLEYGLAVGFGARPAVVVVDFTYGFTDPSLSKLASNYDAELGATAQLLACARGKAVPVFFTSIGFRPDLADAGAWPLKHPSLRELVEGSRATEIDSRLSPMPSEPVILKKYPSAFFGTPLASMLVKRCIDTVIICGCTTSGCVRATVVDALSHGYRVVVPRECVGDRFYAVHVANLIDISNKYADVVNLQTVLEYLGQLPDRSEKGRSRSHTDR